MRYVKKVKYHGTLGEKKEGKLRTYSNYNAYFRGILYVRTRILHTLHFFFLLNKIIVPTNFPL